MKKLKNIGIALMLVMGLCLSMATVALAASIKTPTLVKATPVNYHSIRVTWRPVTGVTGYEVLRKTSSTGFRKIKTVKNAKTSSCLDTTVQTGTRYTYTVRAYKTVSKKTTRSSYNKVGVSATPKLTTPVLSSLTTSGNHIKAIWKKVSGANGYELYRAESQKGTYRRVRTIASGNVVTATDTSKLEGSKRYYYKVRAYRKVGSKKVYSSFSAVKSKLAPKTRLVSITLSSSELTLKVNETATLTIVPNPSDAEVTNVVWSSDNAVVASVDNGVVTALSEGKATISAKAENGKTAKCIVNVTQTDEPDTPDNPPEPDTPTEANKTLVAYFSATHNTEGVAQKIKNLTGADIYQITPTEPYTDEDLNYGDGNSRTTKEMNDRSIRPSISGKVENMDSYKVVFLGYPIWWGKAPNIMFTFLESYDLTGKTIIPFCTSGSSPIGSSATELHPLQPNATWLDGQRFSGGASESTIKDWINTLDLPTAEESGVSAKPYDGVFPQHEAYGKGIGANPGRVVWSYSPDSVSWDGNGYWWRPENFNESLIQNSVNNCIVSLSGEENAADGWTKLFSAYKESKGETGGYIQGEKIAIKANINGSAVMSDDTSGETRMSYTNPVLLKCLLKSLVEQAGVKPSDITVYDVSRLFPDYMVQMCTQENLNGVNFVGRNNGVADESAPIIWSQEFSGATNYLPTCVTEAKYLINLANLKGHSYGITLCGKNHFGSFINGNMSRPPEGANLHQWLIKNQMGVYSPLVDLCANADLGGKTVLYMLDGLICAPSEGASITESNSKWVQSPFNGDYTSSIFVSQDPMAIDSVGADFLINEPTVTNNNGVLRDNETVENYLHEGALVTAPPSGVKYQDSKGNTPTNLGVHEHWNNNTDKQYGRNLGKAEGIELIRIDN